MARLGFVDVGKLESGRNEVETMCNMLVGKNKTKMKKIKIRTDVVGSIVK